MWPSSTRNSLRVYTKSVARVCEYCLDALTLNLLSPSRLNLSCTLSYPSQTVVERDCVQPRWVWQVQQIKAPEFQQWWTRHRCFASPFEFLLVFALRTGRIFYFSLFPVCLRRAWTCTNLRVNIFFFEVHHWSQSPICSVSTCFFSIAFRISSLACLSRLLLLEETCFHCEHWNSCPYFLRPIPANHVFQSSITGRFSKMPWEVSQIQKTVFWTQQPDLPPFPTNCGKKLARKT